ncbi:AGE family epimerase/isomerase [Sphingomonas sp.]|uniref:AGE family epimerase/isomerase n=1 Tax=Sphingomonas sp. TaxID=28214 RepID=UPI003AFFD0AE
MTRAAPRSAADPVTRFVDWVRTDALPTWAERGFDAAAGRFHERLDEAGRPLAVPHRAMVQARQIYVYAHAGMLGWHDRGVELASRAMATLRREFCVHAGGCASVHFSVDVWPFAPRSTVRDAYTHAFVLFAAAYLHRATGDAALLDFADEVIGYIDAELFDPVHGGLFNTAEAREGEKLQNPQMHLLEAYLALAEAAPGRGYLERAHPLVGLLDGRMMRWAEGVLPERFAADWSPHPDPLVAGVFEPGHHFEWIWLLAWYERLSGEALGRCRDALLASATQPSATSAGLIRDQLGADGQVFRAAHRLWPHCEAIKAATACDAPPALAEDAARGLLDHFLGRPFAGGWTDQLSPAREPIVDYVPASSLYHLMLAAAVANGARAA